MLWTIVFVMTLTSGVKEIQSSPWLYARESDCKIARDFLNVAAKPTEVYCIPVGDIK